MSGDTHHVGDFGVQAIDGGARPVGVQIMGQAHADARVAAIARWVAENVAPLKTESR